MRTFKLLALLILFAQCDSTNVDTTNEEIVYWISSKVDDKILKGIEHIENKLHNGKWDGNSPILYIQTFDSNEIGINLAYRKDDLLKQFTEKSKNVYKLKSKGIEIPVVFDYQLYFSNYFNSLESKPGFGGYTIIIDNRGNIKDTLMLQ